MWHRPAPSDGTAQAGKPFHACRISCGAQGRGFPGLGRGAAPGLAGTRGTQIGKAVPFPVSATMIGHRRQQPVGLQAEGSRRGTRPPRSGTYHPEALHAGARQRAARLGSEKRARATQPRGGRAFRAPRSAIVRNRDRRSGRAADKASGFTSSNCTRSSVCFARNSSPN